MQQIQDRTNERNASQLQELARHKQMDDFGDYDEDICYEQESYAPMQARCMAMPEMAMEQGKFRILYD